MISIILETLSNEVIRITGRIDNRTVKFIDGNPADVKKMFLNVAKETAPAHFIGGKLSTQHIRINKPLFGLVQDCIAK